MGYYKKLAIQEQEYENRDIDLIEERIIANINNKTVTINKTEVNTDTINNFKTNKSKTNKKLNNNDINKNKTK